MTQSALNQLKQFTTIVADSSDLAAIEKFRPLDATTNPSLITAAANQAENKALIADAYAQAKSEGYVGNELIERTIDILTVKFGVEILKLIEGRVSTEVDASLSYDTEATIAKAKELLALYAQYGVASDRILIKIASDLGRYSGRTCAGSRRHSYQPDPALWSASGTCLCRCQSYPDFAIRWPYSGLVQKG